MNNYVIAAVIIVTLVSVLTALYYRIKTDRMLDRISKMLDSAMEDTFVEQTFDESRMSALETRFAHYLSASVVSARNVKQEKDKIKSLISDISHQTKTPIANLLLYSELLEEQELTGQGQEYLDAIHGQTNKLRFLIDSLVKLSRLENGILKLSPKQEFIYPLIQKIQKEYQAKAAEKNLQFTIHETDAKAYFDVKWTGEAIGNLVDNAIKYTESGKIDITVSNYEMFTRIDISDTGVGISEEELPKIFTRFYRSQNSNQHEGVGIGLFLAREILHAENGYMKVSSKLQQGSTFSVFLPNQNLSKL